jgi:1-deoxy-D-xylulose-5-phosphate synthase
MKYLHDIDGPADTKKLSVEQLAELAEEVRQEIVSTVSGTGGHLSSNLGVVELTVALHYVFNLPTDKLIWDVSHQIYAHKILSGRRERIHTIRQYGGLSGFAKPSESEYDAFGAGHASTSISAALGFAVARDMAGLNHKVIAVIGDGSMTGGLAFEGMNNAGSLRKDLVVILNDNTWSISKNVGSISKYMTGILADEKFNKLRSEIWELTGRFKRRDKIRETVRRLENSIKSLLVPGMLFEKMGFRYLGPIDGHDIPLLVKTLADIKNISGPVMLHIATTKGKGYAPAEGDATRFHGIGKFDKVTGKTAASDKELPSYTDVFGDTMLELAARDERVVAITAAMAPGTGLEPFSEKYPDRFFDVGIAEGHAGTFAASLAAQGIRPYVVIYSTFMQRAYDQIIHDMANQNLPVVICMDRGGLVGSDGPTHHGAFDLSYLSTVPNVTVAAPRDGNELRAMLHHTVDNELPGVIAFRYPRGKVPVAIKQTPGKIDWGTWEWVTPPGETVLLAVGTMVGAAIEAAARLQDKGIDASVVNARFVKPFDLPMLDQIKGAASAVFTIEENSLRGGFGQAVADYLLSDGFPGKFRALGLPDRFVTHGTREELLRELGLDAEGIVESIEDHLVGRSKPEAGFLRKIGLRRSVPSKKKRV